MTGDVDPGALDNLVRLCLQLAGHGAHCAPRPTRPRPDPAGRRTRAAARARRPPAGQPRRRAGLQQLTALSREAIQQAIIGKAIIFLMHSQYCSELH